MPTSGGPCQKLANRLMSYPITSQSTERNDACARPMQVKKANEELTRQWGTGPILTGQPRGPQVSRALST